MDGSGTAHVVGSTLSDTLELVEPINGGATGWWDVFYARLDPEGAAFTGSTYLDDGDLDVALTDEIAENNGDPNIRIMENGDGSTLCPPAPVACRTSESGRSSITLKDNDDPSKDRLLWKFSKGQTTPKADYGDPTVNGGEDYELCVYEAGVLLMNRLAPAGGTCAGKDCWTEKATSYNYKDKGLTPDRGHDRRPAPPIERWRVLGHDVLDAVPQTGRPAAQGEVGLAR